MIRGYMRRLLVAPLWTSVQEEPELPCKLTQEKGQVMSLQAGRRLLSLLMRWASKSI